MQLGTIPRSPPRAQRRFRPAGLLLPGAFWAGAIGLALCPKAAFAAPANGQTLLAPQPSFREDVTWKWYDQKFAQQLRFGLEIEVIVKNHGDQPANQMAHVAERLQAIFKGKIRDGSVVNTSIGEIRLKMDKSTTPQAVEIVTEPLTLDKVKEAAKLLDGLGSDVLDARAANQPLGIHINVSSGSERKHQHLQRNLLLNYYKHHELVHRDKPLFAGRSKSTFIGNLTPENLAWLEAHPSFFKSWKSATRETAYSERLNDPIPSGLHTKELDLSVVNIGWRTGNRIEFRYLDTILGSRKSAKGSDHLLEEVEFIAALMHVSAQGRIDAQAKLTKDPAGDLAQSYSTPTSRDALNTNKEKAEASYDKSFGPGLLTVRRFEDAYWVASMRGELQLGPYTDVPIRVGNNRFIATHERGLGKGWTLRRNDDGGAVVHGFDRFDEIGTSRAVVGRKAGFSYIFHWAGAKDRSVTTHRFNDIWITEDKKIYGRRYGKEGSELFAITDTDDRLTISPPLAEMPTALNSRYELRKLKNGGAMVFDRAVDAVILSGHNDYRLLERKRPKGADLFVAKGSGRAQLITASGALIGGDADDFVEKNGSLFAVHGAAYEEVRMDPRFAWKNDLRAAAEPPLLKLRTGGQTSSLLPANVSEQTTPKGGWPKSANHSNAHMGSVMTGKGPQSQGRPILNKLRNR